ncbi:MAG: hypothetical protein VX500_06755, partial [Planctomycetota bacterium]|nr:hypothetical protein [Planctomycetota bacterium]
MYKGLVACLVMTIFSFDIMVAQEETLVVYSNVPGAEASDQYELAVRTLEAKGPWLRPFAFVTRCKEGIKGKNNYFPHLSGWSNTFINIEMSG